MRPLNNDTSSLYVIYSDVMLCFIWSHKKNFLQNEPTYSSQHTDVSRSVGIFFITELTRELVVSYLENIRLSGY